MERAEGIEPSHPPWIGGALPLSYTRADVNLVAGRIRNVNPISHTTELCLAGSLNATARATHRDQQKSSALDRDQVFKHFGT
jgi:hypothetical protein